MCRQAGHVWGRRKSLLFVPSLHLPKRQPLASSGLLKTLRPTHPTLDQHRLPCIFPHSCNPLLSISTTTSAHIPTITMATEVRAALSALPRRCWPAGCPSSVLR